MWNDYALQANPEQRFLQHVTMCRVLGLGFQACTWTPGGRKLSSRPCAWSMTPSS